MADLPSLAKLLSKRYLLNTDPGKIILAGGGFLLLETGPVPTSTKHNSVANVGSTTGAART